MQVQLKLLHVTNSIRRRVTKSILQRVIEVIQKLEKATIHTRRDHLTQLDHHTQPEKRTAGKILII